MEAAVPKVLAVVHVEEVVVQAVVAVAGKIVVAPIPAKVLGDVALAA